MCNNRSGNIGDKTAGKRDMTEIRQEALLQFNLSKLQKINGRLGLKGSCKLCKAEFVGLMQNGKLDWQGSHQGSCPSMASKIPANSEVA
jgi:hypothetical protein